VHGGRGWAPPQKKNYFCPQNDVSVHFDAVFNRQKTRTVTRSLMGHGFYAVQSQKEPYKHSANYRKIHGQIKGGGGRPPPEYATVAEQYNAFHRVSLCRHMTFLSRVITALLTRDIDIGIMSVRPSVRHITVLYRNCLTYRHSFFTTR